MRLAGPSRPALSLLCAFPTPDVQHPTERSPTVKKPLRLVSAAAATIALAAFPGPLYGDEVDGCYKTQSGKLRLTTESSPVCLPSEDPISWNQEGPPGICDTTPPTAEGRL